MKNSKRALAAEYGKVQSWLVTDSGKIRVAQIERLFGDLDSESLEKYYLYQDELVSIISDAMYDDEVKRVVRDALFLHYNNKYAGIKQFLDNHIYTIKDDNFFYHVTVIDTMIKIVKIIENMENVLEANAKYISNTGKSLMGLKFIPKSHRISKDKILIGYIYGLRVKNIKRI